MDAMINKNTFREITEGTHCIHHSDSFVNNWVLEKIIIHESSYILVQKVEYIYAIYVEWYTAETMQNVMLNTKSKEILT